MYTTHENMYTTHENMYTTHEKMSTQHKLIPRTNNSNTNLIIMHTSLIACLLIFIVKTI